MTTPPGPIVLLGSGETAPGAQRIYHRLFTQLDTPIRVAVLETPAGFEPNSTAVAEQVATYLTKRLQNFRPQIDIIPARARGTSFTPDDADLAGLWVRIDYYPTSGMLTMTRPMRVRRDIPGAEAFQRFLDVLIAAASENRAAQATEFASA